MHRNKQFLPTTMLLALIFLAGKGIALELSAKGPSVGVDASSFVTQVDKRDARQKKLDELQKSAEFWHKLGYIFGGVGMAAALFALVCAIVGYKKHRKKNRKKKSALEEKVE